MSGENDDRKKPLPTRLVALIGILIFEVVACALLLSGSFLQLGSLELVWLLVAVVSGMILFLFVAAWKLIRNRFQFSLASFLIATLVLGAGFGSLISFLQKSSKQREAAARLTSLGAAVLWENQGHPGLKEYLGRQYFEDVVSVYSLSPLQMTDEDFALLKELPGLRDLSLYQTGISDGHLQHLAKLEHLQFLMICGANVKGPGIKSLANLPILTELHISASPLNNAAAQALSQCTQLTTLGAPGTQIGNDDLIHFQRLPHLRELYLNATAITDDGLKHLEEMPQLRFLGLVQTAITDAGLTHLEKLEKLENLNLSGTQITDAGLVHLESLKHLNNLGLQNTKVTDAGIARLQHKLPSCEIAR